MATIEKQRHGIRRLTGALVTATLVATGLLAEPAIRMLAGDTSGGGATAALDLSMPAGPEPIRWDIPIHRTPEVEHWIRAFSENERYGFHIWLKRMGRYEGPIRRRLAERGIPEDLVYLAMIESGFEPRAVSRVQATGLWQFMDFTARDRGLRISEYVDERLDPIRATEAAAVHLQKLHRQFGSWYLAAAAYNAGATRVSRALRECANDGPDGDQSFWDIVEHLPDETREYVPQLVAAAVIAKNPERFGFTAPAPDSLRYARVFPPGGTPLSAVARAAGASLSELRDLNPHLFRDQTPPDLLYPVRVPVGAGPRTLAGLRNGPDRPPTRLAED